MDIEGRAQPCPEGLNEGWLCLEGLMGPDSLSGKGAGLSREMGVEMGPHRGLWREEARACPEGFQGGDRALR